MCSKRSRKTCEAARAPAACSSSLSRASLPRQGSVPTPGRRLPVWLKPKEYSWGRKAGRSKERKQKQGAAWSRELQWDLVLTASLWTGNTGQRLHCHKVNASPRFWRTGANKESKTPRRHFLFFLFSFFLPFFFSDFLTNHPRPHAVHFNVSPLSTFHALTEFPFLWRQAGGTTLCGGRGGGGHNYL